MRRPRSCWLFWLCLLASACNRVIDSQPTPVPADEAIPASAIQAVVAQFPQAQTMVFTPLEKQQVWQVSFQQKALRYQAVTNTQSLLVAYQLAGAPVPDSLKTKLLNTAVDGGVLSNLRFQAYRPQASPNDQVVLADYDWQNSRYTLRWTITSVSSQNTYLTELLPDTQFQYQTVTLTDLPPLLQQSLTQQQLTFTSAQVQVDGQAKKHYTLTGRQSSAVYTLL